MSMLSVENLKPQNLVLLGKITRETLRDIVSQVHIEFE